MTQRKCNGCSEFVSIFEWTSLSIWLNDIWFVLISQSFNSVAFFTISKPANCNSFLFRMQMMRKKTTTTLNATHKNVYWLNRWRWDCRRISRHILLNCSAFLAQPKTYSNRRDVYFNVFWFLCCSSLLLMPNQNAYWAVQLVVWCFFLCANTLFALFKSKR